VRGNGFRQVCCRQHVAVVIVKGTPFPRYLLRVLEGTNQLLCPLSKLWVCAKDRDGRLRARRGEIEGGRVRCEYDETFVKEWRCQ
jgi:hypothetical protein